MKIYDNMNFTQIFFLHGSFFFFVCFYLPYLSVFLIPESGERL